MVVGGVTDRLVTGRPPSSTAIQVGGRAGVPHASDIREAHASLMTKDTSQAHNGPMRDASGHSLPGDNQRLWQQQVQLSRGHWRRDDAAGAIRGAGWWESVTVTWSLAPAPDRRPAVLQRALAAVGDMIAPVLADAAVTSTRRLLQRRYRGRLAASLLRRQLVSAARELPPSDRTPSGPGPGPDGLSCASAGPRPATIAIPGGDTRGDPEFL
jgi:hypothetical protein